MSLLRVEQADIQVELLNGQRIEVSCRTDCVALDIFSLVVQHMNINEHVFFGLSFIKGHEFLGYAIDSFIDQIDGLFNLLDLDGEHFFIDDHQRLEKFAPPGWKSMQKNGIRSEFILYLRFRFYPQMLDFIKTDVTMHELYLQVRHDIIEGRIQPRRDAAYELAALALQAEFGNRPPPVIYDYFDIQHYLPRRYCICDDQKRLQSVLSEMHGHYAGTKSTKAEHMFIQICQRHRDFGAHFHRLYRNKPVGTHAAVPFDPDSDAALWIAIMPRGIAVYEEQGLAKELLAEHLWQNTQTLQFDRKKSAYFVKFSASQHRFMMRMRQWKSTLKHESTIQAMPDVCVEGREPHSVQASVDASMDDEEGSPLYVAESIFAKMPATPAAASSPMTAKSQSFEMRSSMEKNNNQEVTNSKLIFHCKDPTSGLGLTLVDGNLNGVKGVYVKSVAENGVGMRAGLLVGDRLLAIDGVSLVGNDRHRAVELVRKSGNSVLMEIARLDGVVRHERSQRSNDTTKKLNAAGASGGVITLAAQKGVSRTPPAPRRATNRRQRAISDFGAIGDTLPALDSDNVINIKAISGSSPLLSSKFLRDLCVSRTPPAPRRATNRRQRAISDFGAIGDTLPALDSDNVINIKAISGLHLDESDEEQGEYRLPTTSMYSFDHHYDDESPTSLSAKTPEDVMSQPELLRHCVPVTDGKRKYRYARKSNLEWTDELEDVGEENEFDGDIINVELERNSVGSLGVQIASIGGRVCIKQLNTEPAASHPNLHVGDALIHVNGEPVANKSHQEVVSMLRAGGQVVTLGLKREAERKGNIITAVIDKKPEGSLGLSLAKRTGSEGIFIRMIAANSAAAIEGSLRVGDRVLSLEGENVTDMTPTEILERLRSIQGAIHITVSRDS
ncbi:PDZ/DHR/GLGF domain protein [Dictyocaulus viviparus]|uniref:PDZ/DHR/GLGF domain protein n=1 Tax=Dictyocaulus viviparus TaxID=29172 RepID=A0A0D8XYU0_DICVI|nr:PDZ/DHR/GLGF domain protein [Dictyocaulus viviparus]